MVNVLCGATDKCENCSARIVQNASALTQGYRPFLKRTLFFGDDLFCPAVDPTRNVVDIEIHWQGGQCNLNVERIQCVDVIGIAIGLIPTASVGSCIRALNLRNAIAFLPFFNQQTAINMFCIEPGLKEMDDGR